MHTISIGGENPQGIGVSESVRWTLEQPMVEASLWNRLARDFSLPVKVTKRQA